MTRPVVFDTSVYIPYLRSEAYSSLLQRAAATRGARLSAVVLAELYAGTRSPRDKADLDVVRRAYASLGLVVTPDEDDWARAGQAIRWYRENLGTLEPNDHLNDLLILLSSTRLGAEVVTENARHFDSWARILRRTGLRPRVRAVRRGDHAD